VKMCDEAQVHERLTFLKCVCVCVCVCWSRAEMIRFVSPTVPAAGGAD